MESPTRTLSIGSWSDEVAVVLASASKGYCPVPRNATRVEIRDISYFLVVGLGLSLPFYLLPSSRRQAVHACQLTAMIVPFCACLSNALFVF